MPPKVKFQKEEIVRAALNIARRSGIDAVTAREVAAELGVSPRPIFTYYAAMDQLRYDVRELAGELYREHLRRGLTEEVPFLGIWRQYLTFAREEPELYRLLFLTPPSGLSGGAMEALRYSQELARESVMGCYRMDAHTADCFFRDIWLVAFSCATLIVTDNCPYTDEELLAIGREISLSVCRAYKEIPGLPTGDCDADSLFRSIIREEKP